MMFELRPGTWAVDGYLERLPRVTVRVAPDGCQHVGGAPSALVLASSHGFGLGVSSREAFPERLREALVARGHDLRGTRNCSVPGQQFLAQVRAAERALAAGSHPLAIVLVAPHHLRVAFDWARMAPQNAVLRGLTSLSRVARLIYLLRLHEEVEGQKTRYEPDARLAAGLDRLAAAARAQGAIPVLALLGAPEHPSFDLRAQAAARGIAAIDVRYVPNDPAWTLDGEHWNARGHQRVAMDLAGPVDALLRAASSR